jgi:hypothetical protein
LLIFLFIGFSLGLSLLALVDPFFLSECLTFLEVVAEVEWESLDGML